MGSPHLMLLVSTTGYTGDAFLEAARSLGVPTLVGSDRCHVLSAEWPVEGRVTLDFRHPHEAARQLVEASRERPLGAIVPTSETTARIAAMASERLGLRHNPPAAAQAAANKRIMREMLQSAGVRAPRARVFSVDDDPATIADDIAFPCVLKPLLLSASRGVIRADDRSSFAAAFTRIAALLRSPELLELDPVDAKRILVEPFVRGLEVAVEGLLTPSFRTLAIFDKPDPLDGPFFEETIYVTPSRLPEATQAEIRDVTAAAARAMGLSDGPVHAELRVGPNGVEVIEVAARTIGGLCSRALRFGTATTLEEIVIRHSMGLPVATTEREGLAAGAMMIPIPRAGILGDVVGIERAKAVAGVEDVVITAQDRKLVPLPEGKAYLGFIFARGETPAFVEDALRSAHRCLEFQIRPSL
jgi:formate-dependent phosphoribosylglycinamide formyltransferase (GAR transformylase)